MPIGPSTNFNAVVLWCNCQRGTFGKHWVQIGQSSAADGSDTSLIHIPDVLNPTNAEIAEIISRVRAGTAKAYYYDGSVDPSVFAPVESAPQEFWQFHGRHPFWKNDGYKTRDRLVTKANLDESGGSRHVEFEGGFVPARLPAQSTMIARGLGDWIVSMEGTRVVFTLPIPASEGITSANFGTYGPAMALRNWLNDRRGYRNDNEVPPNRVRQDELPASLATVWPAASTTEINYTPDLDSMIDLELRRNSFGATLAPGTTTWIRVRIQFNVVTTNTGAVTPDIDALNLLMQTQTAEIPGSGQMIEPPHGSVEVPSSARKLVVADSELELDNGLAVVKWKDPGSDVQRAIPLGGGFGRSIDYASLPTQGTGRRMPRPEEFPRVNAVHYTGEGNANLYFESMALFVGFGGADREGVIHNRSSDGSTLSIHGPDGTLMMALKHNETFPFRAMMALDGTWELLGYDLPVRRLVYDSTPHYGIVEPPYRYDYDPSHPARIRPFSTWNRPQPLQHDADAFSFGTGTLALDTVLDATNWVFTRETFQANLPGDIRIRSEVTVQVTGSGSIGGGHSAVLLRKRGDTVAINDRDWQNQLTGVDMTREYTVFYDRAVEVNDQFLVALSYFTAGVSINFQTGLLVINVQREVELFPRIELSG